MINKKLKTFEYSILRYMHDVGAGESLNIGVVIYCKEASYLDVRINHRIKRLSDAFATFNGDQYRRVVAQFERFIEQKAEAMRRNNEPDVLLPSEDKPENLERLLRSIWFDPDVSYQYSGILPGVSDDFESDIDNLYYRFVLMQSEENRRQKRDDETVWQVYQDSLRREKISSVLTERSFPVGEFDFRFKHTFRNGSWQVLEAVSLDYAEKAGIRNRVAKLLGDTKLLAVGSDLGKVYLLLGKPSNPDYMGAYQNALRYLASMELPHQIIEEDHADEFAKELSEYMKKHGVIRQEVVTT